MNSAQQGTRRLKQLKHDVYIAVLVCRDRRTPWYAKLIAACGVGYVFSPVQLIPSFIPVIGWLDDFAAVSLGLALARKLTPRTVIEECRERAATALNDGTGVPTTARIMVAIGILAIWLALAVLAGILVFRALRL
ncbi:MAG: hypothetical protein OJF49_002703 [Ktedonobacterales bacterium]|nr:MAG: hypothetical protein OJF49_002703 [Ktedonobacterales bacterium]